MLHFDADVANVLAGKIAPRLYKQGGNIRLLIDEEFNTLRVGAEGNERADRQCNNRRNYDDVGQQRTR